MVDFVLVHGSFHGPWCWSHLVPLLTAAGHRAITPDLGLAAAPADLSAYARLVAETIEACPDRVVLVGHSMGALVASQTAELIPGKIAASIYVAGLLLRNGETLGSFLEDHAHLGVEDLVLATMETSADGLVARFPEAAAPGIFYNCCSDQAAAWASRQLRPQPTAVYRSPLRLTEAVYGSVPRIYVETRQDRAVSPVYQAAMTARTPCEVVSLDTDHSPFLSMPEALASILIEVARERF